MLFWSLLIGEEEDSGFLLVCEIKSNSCTKEAFCIVFDFFVLGGGVVVDEEVCSCMVLQLFSWRIVNEALLPDRKTRYCIQVDNIVVSHHCLSCLLFNLESPVLVRPVPLGLRG